MIRGHLSYTRVSTTLTDTTGLSAGFQAPHRLGLRDQSFLLRPPLVEASPLRFGDERLHGAVA